MIEILGLFNKGSLPLDNSLCQGLVQLNDVSAFGLERLSRAIADKENLRSFPIHRRLKKIGLLFADHAQTLLQKHPHDPDGMLDDICQELPWQMVSSKRTLFKLDEMSKIMLALSQQEQDYPYNDVIKVIGDIYTAVKMLHTDPSESKNCYGWLLMVIELMQLKAAGEVSDFATTCANLVFVKSDQELQSSEKAGLLVKAILADYQLQRDEYQNRNDNDFEVYLNDHPDELHVARKLGLILKLVMVYFASDMSEGVREEVKKCKVQRIKNPYKDFLMHVNKAPQKIRDSIPLSLKPA